MESVVDAFSDARFAYAQIERQGMVCIYTQTHKESGVVRYEVVRLHIQAAHTWPNGVTTPEKEAYPASGAWGREGWTYFTLPDAQAQMRAVLARGEALETVEPPMVP
jgi:hypothetical protein